MVGTCDYTFVQIHSTKGEPIVNYGLWVTMMSHCSFMDCNKWTTVVEDADSGEGCVRTGAEGYGTPYLLLRFTVLLKIV